MPGLDPGIHHRAKPRRYDWIAGSSPAMTREAPECVSTLARSRGAASARPARSRSKPQELSDPVRFRRWPGDRNSNVYPLADRDSRQSRGRSAGPGGRRRGRPHLSDPAHARRAGRAADFVDRVACGAALGVLRRRRLSRHLVLDRRSGLRLEARVQRSDAALESHRQERRGAAAGDHDSDRLVEAAQPGEPVPVEVA
jgi:hypothetical protein